MSVEFININQKLTNSIKKTVIVDVVNRLRNPGSSRVLYCCGGKHENEKGVAVNKRIAGLVLVAVAQAIAAQAGEAPEFLDEITVTASRIERSGFTAPTPTTVVDSAELQARAPVIIADVLNNLPSFRSSISPRSSSLNQSGAGATFLDLRGLGSTRTLVLVNGRRFVPSTAANQVDVSLIPSLLVDRVEVVTGGASAAYGSDAVAGVVNMLLKNDLSGVRATAQYGVTEYGDGGNGVIGLAGGMDIADGRGHMMLAGEYSKDDGFDDRSRRRREEWIQYRDRLTNTAWATNGQPAVIYSRGVQYANQYPGGVITGGLPASSPYYSQLIGTTFLGGQATGRLTKGQVYGTNMIGGSAVGNYFDAQQDIVAATQRHTVMGRLDYKLTDSVNFNVELSSAQNKAHASTAAFRDAGSFATSVPATTTSLVARIDNPYLPASVRSLMQAAGVNAVFVGRDGYDTGINETDPRVQATVTNRTTRAALGLDGVLGGTFKWDAYYQYGESNQGEVRPGNRIPANYRLAADAVTHPVTGEPVCRSRLTNPSNGCVPFNFFGPDSGSQAARDYFIATARLNAKQSQSVLAANLRGDLFDNWAGPVSIATGAEYRQDKASAIVDANSAAARFEFTNSQPYEGKVSVKEVYLETVIPLLKDVPAFKALDLNAAGRFTDYSTSGGVFTWKTGLSWSLNDQLRLRGTLSRDIRAANIMELYARVSGGAFFLPIDRVMGTVQPNPVATTTSPNALLDPERATTYTFGAIYQPDWLSGLRLSVDHFNIDISGQIARVDGQTIIDRCSQGLSTYCDYIQRQSGTNVITGVVSPFLNLNRFKTSGLDFEGSLSRPMSDIRSSWSGNYALRLLATYTAHLTTVDALGSIDRAGQLTGSGSVNSVPHWQGNMSISYGLDRFSTMLEGRYIGSGNIDNLARPGTNTSSNQYRVGSHIRWNLSASYEVSKGEDGSAVQVFGLVDNLLDQHPPFPYMPSSLVTSPYYTSLGRSYRAGVRLTF